MKRRGALAGGWGREASAPTPPPARAPSPVLRGGLGGLHVAGPWTAPGRGREEVPERAPLPRGEICGRPRERRGAAGRGRAGTPLPRAWAAGERSGAACPLAHQPWRR